MLDAARRWSWVGAAAWAMMAAPCGAAPQAASDPCARPPAGSRLSDPAELRSSEGLLSLELTLRNHRAADGSVHYCYVTAAGEQSPTLRMRPGDLLVLKLKNELADFGAPAAAGTAAPAHRHGAAEPGAVQPEPIQPEPIQPGALRSEALRPAPIHPGAVQSTPIQSEAVQDPCASASMSLTATNLHFHGLTVPPVCHQDEVLKTSIAAGAPPFEYRFKIPAHEPPGLYWYHPHIHGFTTPQVLGGASGALIIEGIERANPALAGMAQRVLVIRDQNLLHPDAPPSKSEPVVPKMLIDRDGDAANNGTGFGKPAKDLSINYVPVPYPDYPPAALEMRPGERQLWRVVNACALTYLNLAVIVRHSAQPLGIVAIDGVPLTANGREDDGVAWRDHIGLPPGARVEFIAAAPPAGTPALLVTRTVDTGQGGENDPNRALAAIVTSPEARPPVSSLPSAHEPLPPASLAWLGDVAPVRVRKLYFSEKLANPADPNSATDFYLTVDGQTPQPFDPASPEPNIVVRQGDVEDWIIENRSTELHAFHIHQLHFLLVGWSGLPVNEPFLRDTVNVPYFNGRTLEYPSVRLRMDFRDPDTVGTFVYHCHLLEHEDGGMMGTIRVLPAT
jgi:FtsP/CotA-like multicopper oxidase with cupredoxin domain